VLLPGYSPLVAADCFSGAAREKQVSRNAVGRYMQRRSPQTKTIIFALQQTWMRWSRLPMTASPRGGIERPAARPVFEKSPEECREGAGALAEGFSWR